MLFEALASGGGSDWYYTILMKAPLGSLITVDDSDEEVTAEGAGDTIIGIPVHNPSSTYNISVVANGFTKTSSATTPATSGGISSLIEVQFGEIDLTFDDEFRGLSATIANEAGTKTATVTLPSTGNTDTLFVPDLGKWIISSTVSGDTFTAEATIGSFSVPESAELMVIPNGKTVLPVNSIEKWLLCGNIKDKQYTTLAEVLADEDTLRKLLTDDNAIDYLKRSTEWADNPGLVPILTGASSSIISSGDHSSLPAWHAFDGNLATRWASNSTSGNDGYIGYTFSNPVSVGEVKGLLSCNVLYNDSVTLKLQYFDDSDSQWKDAGQISTTLLAGNANVYNNYFRIKSTSNATSTKWRVLRTDGDDRFCLFELNFYEKEITIPESELAMSYIGAYDYAADELLDDSTWRDAIFASEYWEKIASGLIPVMTDNNHPSGEASASSTYSTQYPYLAFDGVYDTTNYWYTDTAGEQWLQYEFPRKVDIKNIFVRISTAGGGATTATFNLEYYDDTNDTWVPIKSFVNVKTNTGAPTYDVYNATCNVSSNKFRLDMPTNATITVLEMQVYDHVAGGVQNLLKLAGIDRPYTTIEELLADHEALQKVISSHGAIDYLVETKAFMEEITSDATAMRYIGKRNYAANTLLADINPGLVPIMTDDTHPSGEASANSELSDVTKAYVVFDGNDSSYHCSAANELIEDYYLQYEFDTAQHVRGISLTVDTSSSTPSEYVLGMKASNDGSSWTDLGLTFNCPVYSQKLKMTREIDGDTAYKYFRVYIKSGPTYSHVLNTYAVMVDELQFYAQPVDAPLWYDAICNSEYFENVLNKKVPKMTSNTAPEGVVSASSSYHPSAEYQAFDEASNTTWIGTSNNNQWIAYTFDEPVCVNKCSITIYYERSTRVRNFKIEGYDGSTWQTVYTGLASATGQGTVQTFHFDNSTKYIQYRLYVVDNYGGSNDYIGLTELQFYGRTDVDETMIDVYSAANDSFYEKDSSGNTQIIDTTDSNGHAQVSRTDLPNGIHTLYSSVAKNPNDLEAATPSDYFKTVKVDNSTIEIMLMPDDALYWYGYEDSNLEDTTTANGWTVGNTGGNPSTGTWTAPTHNTQYMTATSPADYSYQGIGTKNKIPVSVKNISSIVEGLTSGPYANSESGDMYAGNAKTAYKGEVVFKNAIYKVSEGLRRLDCVLTQNLITPITEPLYAVLRAGFRGSANFYGFWYDRDKTPTYLSAAYDTLYILDGARQIPIATTNGEGKSFDALLEPGTYDIYSSVAKDLSNLNNPYHVQVTITSNTQTVNLIPNNPKLLYWYGHMSDDAELCSSATGWSFSGVSSNYTMKAPVNDGNHMVFDSSGSAYITAIASKEKVQVSSLHCIVDGKIAYDSSCYELRVCSDKNCTPGGNNYTDALGLQKYDYDVTPQTNYIMFANGCESGRQRLAWLYAFWYE